MNNNEEPRSLIVYVFWYKLGPVYNQSTSVNKATLFIIKFDGSNWMEEPGTKEGEKHNFPSLFRLRMVFVRSQSVCMVLTS